MTGLDWFEARTLARNGTAVRRDAWRKWLTFESFVWLITQPVWLEQEYDRRVVQQWDFGSAEFLAHDWTDENWPDGPQPPDPPDPPQPPVPPGGGGNNGGGGNGEPPADERDDSMNTQTHWKVFTVIYRPTPLLLHFARHYATLGFTDIVLAVGELCRGIDWQAIRANAGSAVVHVEPLYHGVFDNGRDTGNTGP